MTPTDSPPNATVSVNTGENAASDGHIQELWLAFHMFLPPFEDKPDSPLI